MPFQIDTEMLELARRFNEDGVECLRDQGDIERLAEDENETEQN